MKKLGNLLATVLLGSVLPVQAQFVGASSGVFQNPAGPPGMVTLGENTSTILFGDGNGFGTGPSSLSFAGTGFSTPAEASFSLGSLTYFNGTTVAGTEMTSVNLNVQLSFTSPSGLTENFVYPLTITMTPNTGTAEQNADFVTLPPFSSTVFTTGGTAYTLAVGFGSFTGGGFLSGNEFHVYEGSTAVAPVIGTITENISGVPDAGSTLALLSGALTILGIVRRK